MVNLGIITVRLKLCDTVKNIYINYVSPDATYDFGGHLPMYLLIYFSIKTMLFKATSVHLIFQFEITDTCPIQSKDLI